MIAPVYEQNAPEEVQPLYKKLKESLGVRRLPLYFSYLGAFPDYLKYITSQLTGNLLNQAFISLCEQKKAEIKKEIDINAPKTDEIDRWLKTYKNSPAFYHFQNDLSAIFLTNIKMVFIFLSLREAVKGWAIAAKKLPNVNFRTYGKEKIEFNPEEFVYDDFDMKENTDIETSLTNTTDEKTMSVRGNYALEKNLLQNYLNLCRNEFTFILKTDSFWQMRVRIEENLLNDLSLLPDLIFSPINVVLRLTEKYPDFPDLLYLLSEHFPTYAMQRMLFSGYMLA